MRTSHRILIHAVVAAVALAAGSSFAQQTTGTPGSPSATTTIPGEQIPAPPQKFGGAIKDTAPQSTILQAAGVKQPMAVDGIKQSPIEGVSMTYTFDKKNANAASTRKTQYFETMGDRAIYHDGWIASTKAVRLPWDVTAPAHDPMTVPWELFDLRSDWTQSTDVAAKNPEKLKQMQALFWRSVTSPASDAAVPARSRSTARRSPRRRW